MKKFYGYKNEKEARKCWGILLDSGIKTLKQVSCCSRDKHCTGSIDGINYNYSDGSSDTGILLEETTIIIGDNIIKY